MFGNLRQIPLPLRKVNVLMATPLQKKQFDRVNAGMAIKRLRYDARLAIQILGNVESHQADAVLRKKWNVLLMQLLRGGADGVVWIDQNITIEDYQLVERLAEAWSQHGHIILVDANRRPIFWALSRKAAIEWQKHYAKTQPEAAKSPKNKPLWPEINGVFPLAEMRYADECGLKPQQHPISFSIDDGGIRGDGKNCIVRGSEVLPIAESVKNYPPLLVVCATRQTQARFMSHTLLGQSLPRIKALGVDIRVIVGCDNKNSLAEVYNKAFKPEHAHRIACFVHDDVWLDDVWLGHRLQEALLSYDVVGVAGNKNLYPHQPGWPFPQKRGQWDVADNLVGRVAHSLDNHKHIEKKGEVTVYGASRGPVRNLDGVLLAGRVDVLMQAGVRFDERFTFHFYDADFCRTAETRGLRIGVWPIAITHQSGGAFGGSLEWHASFGSYIGKWHPVYVNA
jgi:hypothetical protein